MRGGPNETAFSEADMRKRTVWDRIEMTSDNSGGIFLTSIRQYFSTEFYL